MIMAPNSSQHQVAQLHRQVAELQNTVLDLRRKLLPAQRYPASWGLSRCQDRILALIIDNAPHAVSYERVAIAASGLIDNEMSMDTLKKHVSLLRSTMRSIGVPHAIKAQYGVGYYMPVEQAKVIKARAEREVKRCQPAAQ